jgi:hypothetical protein
MTSWSGSRPETVDEASRNCTYNLQLHRLSIELYSPDFLDMVSHWAKAKEMRTEEVAYKVNTDRRDVGLGVGVVGETQEQARLSNTGVTDEEQLEEIVVSR